MVIHKWTVTSAIVLVAGFVFYFFIYDSPEKQIQKQFAVLAEKLEKQTGESPLISAGKAKAAADFFSHTCTVDIPEYDTQKKITAKEMARHILAFKSRFVAVQVKFYDLSVELTGENTALVAITAETRTTSASGEAEENIIEFECLLEKIEDNWKFYHISAVEVLEK
ncbi:MAG: hypothetical protein KKE62_03020 [Proteobacteria bacterium]|nr:hypothetical protein [Pseudomonadota bacterium]MBU1387703.1 hypothetical protein [Pseudomonadota bacterium]MBU1541795.1 hypothetical protein [Pseudomonadota bacterium]MBU2480740.1 hypothetical protein [Pseudomonadota bacterium]